MAGKASTKPAVASISRACSRAASFGGYGLARLANWPTVPPENRSAAPVHQYGSAFIFKQDDKLGVPRNGWGHSTMISS